MFELLLVIWFIVFPNALGPQIVDLFTPTSSSTTTNFEVKKIDWSTLQLKPNFECNSIGIERSKPTKFLS